MKRKTDDSLHWDFSKQEHNPTLPAKELLPRDDDEPAMREARTLARQGVIYVACGRIKSTIEFLLRDPRAARRYFNVDKDGLLRTE